MASAQGALARLSSLTGKPESRAHKQSHISHRAGLLLAGRRIFDPDACIGFEFGAFWIRHF
jgi:hypothetical protein